MPRLAAELGFEYHELGVKGCTDRCRGLHLFSFGTTDNVRHVIEGKIQGAAFRAFDYCYINYEGSESRSSNYYQAVVFELSVDFPRLMMRPAGMADSAAWWVDGKPLRFESEAFNQRCAVLCEDRRFAYDIFHLRLIEALLAVPYPPVMEMRGSQLLLYYGPSIMSVGDPENVRKLLAIGQQVIASIPGYVRREFATDETVSSTE